MKTKLNPNRVRVAFEFDGDLTDPIVYPLVLPEAARHPPYNRSNANPR